MDDSNDQILGKKDKIIIGSMLVFLILLISLLYHYGYFENKDRDSVLNKEFTATIVKKYINEKEHMTPMVKLSNGTVMVNYFQKNNIELSVGDSLVKRKNSTDMQVYRTKNLIYSINLLEK